LFVRRPMIGLHGVYVPRRVKFSGSFRCTHLPPYRVCTSVRWSAKT
jgi:hypothetical protein